jgi:Ala-tRNA(Pro) deacylase
MTTLARLLAFLDANGVPYTHTTHPAAYTAREVAGAERLPAHRVAKTVVFADQRGYALAVLPGDEAIDLAALRDAAGSQFVRLAREREVADLFLDAREVGAEPPFGNGTLFELPVYVDADLAAEDQIALNAGTHHDVVRMRYADFARLVKPVVLHFSLVSTS